MSGIAVRIYSMTPDHLSSLRLFAWAQWTMVGRLHVTHCVIFTCRPTTTCPLRRSSMDTHFIDFSWYLGYHDA